MRIANNLPALTAFTSLNRTNKSLQRTINVLSTGLRINSASDDAAGLAVSEKMRTQISGLDEALRNTQDGMSLLQTAEGALEQTSSMLQRMRELTLQASNGTLTSQDRQYIQLEVDGLKDQIDRIAGTTQFNRKRILDGSSGALWSSSDAGVRARINGGLTYTDKDGNKASAEGNYRIDVKADPGLAQVQKSNIFNLDVQEERFIKELVPVLNRGVIRPATKLDITSGTGAGGATSGNGWNFDGKVLTITGEGDNRGYWDISGTGQTANQIKIASGVNADIYFSNVDIDVSASRGECAFEIESGAEVKIYLNGDANSLKSGENRAGLEAAKGSKLTLSSISGDAFNDGYLYAEGGGYGAGIGGSTGGSSVTGGDITIMGGTIYAQGGDQAAGIGGGSPGSGGGGAGRVIIFAGDVEAHGGRQGAGIGSGHGAGASPETYIAISGGKVRAYGGSASNRLNGAGIGGACHSAPGTVIIKQGLVQWDTSRGSGMVAADSSPVFAQRGAPNSSINRAQDIGPGTDYNGEIQEPDIMPSIPVEGIKYTEVTISDSTVRSSNLRSIKKFYDASGKYLIEHPQTITITQGNGKTADVTLNPSDDIPAVVKKINDAIANTLGQKSLADNSNKFCTLASGPDQTSESVCVKEDVYRNTYLRDDNGYLVLDQNNNPILTGREKTGEQIVHSTILVRSAIPGKAGELYFSGDEDILNALGLNTIQESSESRFTASVYDAHSGAKINTMTAEGGEFKSIIPPEIDIDIDPMTTAISAKWDDNTKRFMFAHNQGYTAMLHLKDNGITFQTGANGGEDFTIQLGDMSSQALGLSSVNVVTRETASRSMAIIDSAISRVSSQRAKIGAYQNALEHTSESLTITSANLTESESRIRDADMADYMMDFVRLQILNQSGTSMLSQANQLPQSVLSLFGN